jgi:hypothetical protein
MPVQEVHTPARESHATVCGWRLKMWPEASRSWLAGESSRVTRGMPGPTEEPKSSFEKTKSNSFETGHQRGEISANMEEGEIDAVEKPRP